MTFTRPTPDRWQNKAEFIRNRAILRAQRKPCARCGRAIAYNEPYWLNVNGRRRVNPRAFVAGHKVSRAAGGGHELTNLQPECARCSIRSGASEGARRLNTLGPKTRPAAPAAQPNTYSRW